jgi:hypothetical protein
MLSNNRQSIAINTNCNNNKSILPSLLRFATAALWCMSFASLFGLAAPSPSTGEEAVVLNDEETSRPDYRGFLFVTHETHGFMLLRCTRKKSKPPHWQLPGGHVDDEEFVKAGTCDIPSVVSVSY